MKSTLLIGWVATISLMPKIVLGQCSDTTIYATQDSYTTSFNPNGNYWNSSSMSSGTTYISGRRGGGAQYHRRAFVEFDVSSIPSNAIITEATMKLTRNGAISGSFDWKTKLITSSWSESAITAAFQPTISGLSSDVTTTTATTASLQEMDVTEMVQRMVYGATDNYGWCVQVSNELANSNTGCGFYTSNYSTIPNYQPRLYIEYYLPVTLSNVTLVHESATGAADGSISPTHTCFDDQGYTYSWINALGSTIATTQNLSNVSYGWYGLEITGNGNGEKVYFGFLVGTECKEVTISYTTMPEYTSNAYVYDWVSTGGIDFKDMNFGNSTYLQTENRYSLGTSTWSDAKSYLDFNLWVDEDFSVNQANLLMQGFYHYNSGTTNTAQLNNLTDYWNEDIITWNVTPSVSSVTSEVIQNTNTSNQDATWDFKSLWNVWKYDNSSNNGVIFQLQDFDDNVDAGQMYNSPNGAFVDRPSWTFKVRLGDEGYECDDYTFFLKNEVEQTIAYVPGSTLKFKFQEDYNDASGNVSFKLTLLEDDTEQTGTITKNHQANWFELENGVGGVSLQSGKVYILEVGNAKGQKRYLKLKMS